MAQHDYSIANQGFPATRADINNVLSAISTNNSGTSAPSTQFAGQFWIDTTSSTWTLYIHDGADDIQFATIDTSANTVNFIDSELGDNSVTTAKIADANVTSAKLVYPLTTFSSTGIDDNATSTAITIDSSENVDIVGTTTSSNFIADGTGYAIKIAFNGTATLNNNSSPVIFAGSGASGDYLAGTLNIQSRGDGTARDINLITGATPSNTLTAHGNGDISFYEDTGTTAKFFWDASAERLGIGNSAPQYPLEVTGVALINGNLVITGGTDTADRRGAITHDGSSLIIKPSGNSTNRNIIFERSGDGSADETMRIDSSGNLLVGKTSGAFGTAGIGLFSSGSADFVNSDRLLVLNRLSTDGALMGFYQAGSEEGSISVSGSTVSYNGFTGTHWSRFTDNSTPTILRGTVLESLDEMCDWYNLHFDVTTTTQDEDGNDVTETHAEIVPHVLLDSQSDGDVITYNHEGTDVQATIVKETDIKHMKSKVSDNSDAKNVYGVFVAYDLDGEGYNDFYVASVGSYVVRIKSGETLAKGDLLQSNGDGTAKVQSDDNIKSSSFAKVLSTTIIETYEDGSYLVPCSLMC